MADKAPLPPFGEILESIFRDAPEYFVVLDTELQVSAAGETFRRVLGLEPGREASFLDTIERFSLSKTREVFEALRHGDGEHRQLEVFHHRPNGEAIPVAYSWVACMDDTGSCRAFVGIGREPAVHVESGSEVERLKAQLETMGRDLERRTAEIARLRKELESQTAKDEMTGLMNRRFVMERLEEEVARAIRYDEAMTLVLFDIDHVSHVNETYGQDKGDEVIRSVAEVVGEQIRGTDIASRFGGEEFLVLCPHTDRTNAQFLAERLRRRVAELSFRSEDGQEEFGVTISVGLVSVSSGNEFDVEAILAAAEQALESAKNGGMNRVRLMEVV
jgi:diguanylate cyclase (GGDEF)-like protein